MITREEQEFEAQARDAAGVKLVEALYKTPEDRMSEMTSLRSREVFVFSLMEMWDKLLDKNYKPGSLLSVFRRSLYRHKRSLGGAHMIRASVLAEAQLSEWNEREYEDEEIE